MISVVNLHLWWSRFNLSLDMKTLLPMTLNFKLMKYIILLTCIAFVFISGCKKEKLLKQIDGNWTITKVVYSGGTLGSDSIINNPGTIFFFEKCSVKESGSVSNCFGKFGKAGNEVEFNYSFQKQENGETTLGLYAAPPSSNIENYNEVIRNIAGTYEILELSNSKLRIKSTCCVNWFGGADNTYNTRYIEATQ